MEHPMINNPGDLIRNPNNYAPPHAPLSPPLLTNFNAMPTNSHSDQHVQDIQVS